MTVIVDFRCETDTALYSTAVCLHDMAIMASNPHTVHGARAQVTAVQLRGTAVGDFFYVAVRTDRIVDFPPRAQREGFTRPQRDRAITMAIRTNTRTPQTLGSARI